MNRKLIVFLAAGMLLASDAEDTMKKMDGNDLIEAAVRDTLIPVRQGGVNGRPFWNTYSKQFISVPSFEFAPVPGAASYRFEAADRCGRKYTFTAGSPQSLLTPIWRELPAGPVFLDVMALDKQGKVIQKAGTRVFYRNAPFCNGYPPAARSYAEAAKMTYDYLFNLKAIQELADREPDLTFTMYCYPSKMYSSIIEGMVNYAEMEPSKKARAHAIARGAADYLIKKSVPAGEVLEYLPQTYEGDQLTAKKYAGTIMMIYPCNVGSAMLKLHGAVKDGKYLDYARKIGNTYLKLQLKNGTWNLNLKVADGKPKDKNCCIPTSIIGFLEELSAVTKDTRYQAAARKAMPHLLKRLETFDWEGQFEDVEAQQIPYKNLTLHAAVSTIFCLCGKPPVSPEILAQAREVLRFVEDQFIIWEQPGWAGSDSVWHSCSKEELRTKKWGWFRAYHVPCGLEQYSCYVPIDTAGGRIARLFLLMYQLEKNPLDLAKARALGDSLTRLQQPSGRIPTWAEHESPSSDHQKDWINCMFSSANTLKMLAEFQDKQPKGKK